MASRKEQKEAARQRRLAEQQAAAERVTRIRRLRIFGGAVSTAVVVVAVAIALSAGGGKAVSSVRSPAARAAQAHVDGLLAGIPESGATLGRPSAPVTVTEYGDLECSVCDVLATPPSFTNPEGERGSGWLDKLITDYVRTGKAKLVYRSLETASSLNPDQNAFMQQQVAAYAAGLQDKAWYYIELMYNEQGHEGTNYVTQSYLEGLAKQIPGLDYSRWMADRKLPSLVAQVNADNTAGIAVNGAANTGTPTLVFQGPRGQLHFPAGLPATYSAITGAISKVS